MEKDCRDAPAKEAESWSTWQSVEPLDDREARKVFRDPVLGKRILRSRACYRDKSLGVGEMRPKCRIVALGHLDPDLGSIHRNSATPGRLAEHYVYAMIVAGHNRELFGSKMRWQAWLGDAATAFLQGRQSDRILPLYLLPPKEGLIAQTNTWQHQLYRIRGNIYGLANAPYTWYKEVLRRLQDLHYQQHSFDKQFFYKTVGDEVVSIVLVYVDDFIGAHRQDYCIEELHSKFKWGSLSNLKLNEPATFKGKELTLQLNDEGRYVMKVTMKKFINGLDSGSLPRGRLQGKLELSPSEQKELRSVSGCLQWAATQTRPEIAATVSLTAHGAEAKIQDLKNLYSTIGFLKETSDRGILIQDVPINKQTLLIGYSDASWANAKKSGSQIGALVGLTTSDVMERPAKMILLDWKSSRSVGSSVPVNVGCRSISRRRSCRQELFCEPFPVRAALPPTSLWRGQPSLLGSGDRCKVALWCSGERESQPHRQEDFGFHQSHPGNNVRRADALAANEIPVLWWPHEDWREAQSLLQRLVAAAVVHSGGSSRQRLLWGALFRADFQFQCQRQRDKEPTK